MARASPVVQTLPRCSIRPPGRLRRVAADDLAAIRRVSCRQTSAAPAYPGRSTGHHADGRSPARRSQQRAFPRRRRHVRMREKSYSVATLGGTPRSASDIALESLRQPGVVGQELEKMCAGMPARRQRAPSDGRRIPALPVRAAQASSPAREISRLDRLLTPVMARLPAVVTGPEAATAGSGRRGPPASSPASKHALDPGARSVVVVQLLVCGQMV